ncbi:hypothetical protein QOZ80_5AG0387740 [Eleusine coracana subsp. coracana]|nr:hypothetical protein QOZ80_5AG0387740 [Eleusine coracana subsp. coracana]
MAPEGTGDSWEYSLRKYLLLLATLVGTITYTAGFNPPGGVWQDTDAAAGRLAGDPIFRNTSYRRYLAFFYTNADAFACSLVVIVLILIVALLHEKKNASLAPLSILRFVMVLDLFSLMGAYAAGTCRDKLTTVYSLVLVFLVVVYLFVQMGRAARTRPSDDIEQQKRNKDLQKQRKVLMLLATFAVSITYVAGLSAPGGFWDHSEGGHRPGFPVLKGRQDARLRAFFLFNTTAFAASLLIIALLLDKNLRLRNKAVKQEVPLRLHIFIILVLIGLMGAYATGSCRKIDTSIKETSCCSRNLKKIRKGSWLWKLLMETYSDSVEQQQPQTPRNRSVDDQEQLTHAPQMKNTIVGIEQGQPQAPKSVTGGNEQQQPQALNKPAANGKKSVEKARSLVLLLATLAVTITYQAGLDPPGGLWEDDGAGYKSGDPILLTTNPRRYKAFFYCNSVAFVASLVAIILVKLRAPLKYHALEAAMILDLFGLIGAYAAGSCRDVSTSIYAMALAGAVLVYVVIHVVFFTLDHHDNNNRRRNYEDFLREQEEEHDLLEKRRKRLLLFAILAATITYQAGLTPPSGFRLQDDMSGHHAGEPVLLYNYPRRYKTFFYCNSKQWWLLRAMNMTVALDLFGLLIAYAVGSSRSWKSTGHVLAIVIAVLAYVVVHVLLSRFIGRDKKS